jgi:hypothetical protein
MWSNISEPSNKSDVSILYGNANLPAEDCTENTASCLERQNDECRKDSKNQHEGHRGSGSQSQVKFGWEAGGGML